jgi:hypothetical protein
VSDDEHPSAFLRDRFAQFHAHTAGCTTFFGDCMSTTLVRPREISLALLVTVVADFGRPCKHVDALATDSRRLLRLGREFSGTFTSTSICVKRRGIGLRVRYQETLSQSAR